MTSLTHARIPRRAAPVLFACVMSASLGGVMSGVITAINTGIDGAFIGRWLHAYALAFALAFPSVTFIALIVQRFVDRITNGKKEPLT